MRTQDLEKRERILDSTEQIIRTDGIAAVSLSKIAKAANIAPGTLYTYFTDKNDMLRTLYLNRKKALAAAITTIDLANDPVQELNHFMDLVFDYGKQHLDDMLLIREFNQAAILKQLGITVQDAYAGFEVLATLLSAPRLKTSLSPSTMMSSWLTRTPPFWSISLRQHQVPLMLISFLLTKSNGCRSAQLLNNHTKRPE